MSHEQRVALMLAFALLVFLALGTYVYHRVASVFRLPARAQGLWYVFFALTALCAVLPRFFASSIGGLAPILGAFAALVVLGLGIGCVLLVPYELWRASAWLFARLFRATPARFDSSLARGTARFDEVAPADLSRRSFVHKAAVGGALSLGLGASAYGTLFGRHDYMLETIPIKLGTLPRSLDGFRIVQLSDLHVGSFVGEYEFQRGLELVKRAKPDLIVLTGDLIDHDLRYLSSLGRFTRALAEQAPHGLYAVMGNHDHYAGVQQVESVLSAAGGSVLTNRHVRVGAGKDSFVLAGIDDVVGAGPGRGPNLERAFSGAPRELPRLLLSHNPGYFPTSHTHADLTLSGHTHGGQITLFINPAQLLLRHGLVRGHYWRGASQLYVNRGFGTAGPPTRVGSPPEITKLILTV